MSDPFSIPKLSVNLSDIAVEAKAPVQRLIGTEKRRSGEPIKDPELQNVCRQMESLFIHHLFKEMRATIHKTGFISGGRAEEIYTSMLDAEVATKIATKGGIGLSEMLLRQLGTRQKENSDDTDE